MSVDRSVVIVGVANLRDEWGCSTDDEGGGSGLARLIRNISIKFVFIFLFYTFLSFIRIIRILEIFFYLYVFCISSQCPLHCHSVTRGGGIHSNPLIWKLSLLFENEIANSGTYTIHI